MPDRPRKRAAPTKQALARRPTDPAVLTNYGAFLHAQGDFTAAARILERIVPPAPARALVALTESYRQLGRTSDAQATLATAERLYPRDPAVSEIVEIYQRDATR